MLSVTDSSLWFEYKKLSNESNSDKIEKHKILEKFRGDFGTLEGL